MLLLIVIFTTVFGIMKSTKTHLSKLSDDYEYWRLTRKMKVTLFVMDAELQCAKTFTSFHFDLHKVVENLRKLQYNDKEYYESYYKIVENLKTVRLENSNDVPTKTAQNILCVAVKIMEGIPKNEFYQSMAERIIADATLGGHKSLTIQANSLHWFETCLVSFNMW